MDQFEVRGELSDLEAPEELLSQLVPPRIPAVQPRAVEAPEGADV